MNKLLVAVFVSYATIAVLMSQAVARSAPQQVDWSQLLPKDAMPTRRAAPQDAPVNLVRLGGAVSELFKPRKREITPVSSGETRIRIAIVDTGVDMNHPHIAPYLCKGGHSDFTGAGLQDTHGHGTHIAGLVTKGLDPNKICIISLKWYSGAFASGQVGNEVEALRWAIQQQVRLINFSGGGQDTAIPETVAVTDAVRAGIYVVVAAGNEGMDLGLKCGYFPACSIKHEKLFVVGSLDRQGRRLPSSNYGGPVVNWAPGLSQLSAIPNGKLGTMSGTSQATANYSNLLLGGKGESWPQ